jgi:uncharacterized protein with PQ loop repeat
MSPKISVSLQSCLVLYRYRSPAADGELHMLDVGVACGYLGALLGVCMVIPQIARTFRNRQAPGVSPLSWALTAMGSSSWLLYGLRAHEGPQIPGNVLVVAGAVVILLAAPARIGERQRAAMLAIALVVLVGCAVALSTAVVGLIAFSIGIVSSLPQIIRSLGGPTGTTSAVSIPTWMLRGASQIFWLVFAVVEKDTIVFASANFILFSSLLVSVAELRRQRRTTSLYGVA